jgi:hypothetical protein
MVIQKETQKENKTKAERKTQCSTSEKLFNGAHCGTEALVKIPQFSAQNLKHHSDSDLGALEVKFGPLLMGKPDWVGLSWM